MRIAFPARWALTGTVVGSIANFGDKKKPLSGLASIKNEEDSQKKAIKERSKVS